MIGEQLVLIQQEKQDQQDYMVSSVPVAPEPYKNIKSRKNSKDGGKDTGFRRQNSTCKITSLTDTIRSKSAKSVARKQ